MVTPALLIDCADLDAACQSLDYVSQWAEQTRMANAGALAVAAYLHELMQRTDDSALWPLVRWAYRIQDRIAEEVGPALVSEDQARLRLWNVRANGCQDTAR
jgi:hypothetical protein